MNQDSAPLNPEKSDKPGENSKPRQKARKPIRPCLIPGHFYFVDDLIAGGLASKNTFTEWYRKGLKPLNLGTRRLVVSADAIIQLGMMDGKGE